MARDTRIKLKDINLPERKQPIALADMVALEQMSPKNTAITQGANLLAKAMEIKAERNARMKQANSLSSMSGLDPNALMGLDRANQMAAFKEVVNPRLLIGPNGEALGTSPTPMQQLRNPQQGSQEWQDERNSLLRERNAALNRERDENQLIGVMKTFDAHPVNKRNQQSIDAARVIRELAMSGNPIAAAAIPTYAARMSGEVGNLSEPDKKPFGGSRALDEQLAASFNQMASGQLSPANYQFLIDLTELIEKKAQQNTTRLARQQAKKYASPLKMAEKDLFERLDPYGEFEEKAVPKPGGKKKPVGEMTDQELLEQMK